MNKFKLINKQTGESHLCEKIEIDGFDYYVSDENRIIGDYYIGKGFNGNNIFQWSSSQEIKYPNQKGKVIATNNPNIDCPKVVDEVGKLSSNYIDVKPSKISKEFDFLKGLGFIDGYNKSQETHPNSDEDMKSFLKFSIEYRRYNDLEGLSKTSDELLQLWKEQKPKTIYYE